MAMKPDSRVVSRAGKRQVAACFALAASALVTSDARANSAMPHTIDTSVEGNSVCVCEHRMCDPGGLEKQLQILRHGFVLAGEALALVVEGLVYASVARPRALKRGILASALANTVSFGIGLAVL
jgi:hypothetical protein